MHYLLLSPTPAVFQEIVYYAWGTFAINCWSCETLCIGQFVVHVYQCVLYITSDYVYIINNEYIVLMAGSVTISF